MKVKNNEKFMLYARDNIKGITLATLVVTIIVLLILASVATYSGIEAIQNTKMTTFTAELKIMQTHINDLYAQWSSDGEVNVVNDKKEIITYVGKGNGEQKGIQDIGEDISKGGNPDINNIIKTRVLKASGNLTEQQNNILNSFKFYPNSLIKHLGIEGTDQNFYVSVPYRIVVSELGLKYKDKMYYTLDEVPNGFYNVEYENKNTSTQIDFEVKSEFIKQGQAKITVGNINYAGYNNKWKVLYQKEGNTSWESCNDLIFMVNESGTYTIRLVNANGDIVGTNKATVDVSTQMPIYAMLYTIGNSESNLELVLSSKDSSNVTRTGEKIVKINENDCIEISTTPFTSTDVIPWYSNATKIKQVTFEDVIMPASTQNWFNGCTELTQINNMKENLDTSYVKNMESMFSDCRKLVNLDLERFNTHKVTNMVNLFHNCVTLTELNVSSFDTSNVTDMNGIFSGDCIVHLDTKTDETYEMNLTNIKGLTSFNTSKVTNMDKMFYMCTNITSLDVSSFDTKNVTTMKYMFGGNWNYTRYNMKLKEIQGLENFNTSNVENMFSMFGLCPNISSLNVSSFDTGNVTSMQKMFCGCDSLISLDLGNFDTKNVKNMRDMFSYCSNLTLLDLKNFDTSNLVDSNKMFKLCKNLKTIYVSDKFVTNNIGSSTDMFNGCTKLVGGEGTPYDENYVDKTYARIDGGTSNPGYFTK